MNGFCWGKLFPPDNCAIYPQQQVGLGNGLDKHVPIAVEAKKPVGKCTKTRLRPLRIGVLEKKLSSTVRGGQQRWKGPLITDCNVFQLIPTGHREELGVGGCHVGIQFPILDEVEVLGAQASFAFSAILYHRSLNLKAIVLSLARAN